MTISFDPKGGPVALVDAQRHSEGQLGDFRTGLPGYNCDAADDHMFGIRYQEQISDKAGNTLLENFDSERDPSTRGWSAEFVRRFMADNHITLGGLFFDCNGLRKLLDDGSPATLGTTAASKRQFF